MYILSMHIPKKFCISVSVYYQYVKILVPLPPLKLLRAGKKKVL